MDPRLVNALIAALGVCFAVATHWIADPAVAGQVNLAAGTLIGWAIPRLGDVRLADKLSPDRLTKDGY